MKKRIFTTLLAIMLAVGAITAPVAIMVATPVPAQAATEATVTVTATPEYVAMTNAPATWTINGLTGSGVIDVDTVYYANPLGDTTPPTATVVDTECNFTITNTSTVVTDVFVNWGASVVAMLT